MSVSALAMTGTMLTTLLRRLMNSTSRGRRLETDGEIYKPKAVVRMEQSEMSQSASRGQQCCQASRWACTNLWWVPSAAFNGFPAEVNIIAAWFSHKKQKKEKKRLLHDALLHGCETDAAYTVG